MAALGILTVAPLSAAAGGAAGGTVAMDILNFDDGFPHADPTAVVEPITAMGVNYSRLRIVRYEFIPFRLSTLTAFNTYADAVTAARQYRQFVGHVGSLIYTAGGVQYSLGNMYLNSLVAAPASGTVIGAALAVGAQGQAFVRTQFNLQFVAP